MTDYGYYIKSDLSQYAGQWVAILGSRVIVHDASFKKVAESVDKDPAFRKALVARIPEKMAHLL